MLYQRPVLLLLAIAMLLCMGSGQAEPPAKAPGAVVIFAAGSLRGVVAELAAGVESAYHIKVIPTFGGSGALRERIEHGAPADLLLSADVGSPRKPSD